MSFPADGNGDVLRRMLAAGDDLTKPRDIDFNHVFVKEEEALAFLAAVRRLGYDRASHQFLEAKKLWDARVVVFMMPTHSEVTRVELKFDAVAREFLGRADGWGCLAVT
jgi:hypothetical protein